MQEISQKGYGEDVFCSLGVLKAVTWIEQDSPYNGALKTNTEQFLEFETHLNMITEPSPYIGMCQYEPWRFDGAILFKILQAHLYMVAVRKPFYLEPEESFNEFKLERYEAVGTLLVQGDFVNEDTKRRHWKAGLAQSRCLCFGTNSYSTKYRFCSV